MEKPVVAIWGLGDSYRDRIKFNIETAIKTGYDNIMDYVILTDLPGDFDEFRLKNKKIIDVVNIHEIREKYPNTKELEYIPNDQENYGGEYRESWSQEKHFSYSLNRFSLPRISELGYKKIVMHDPDADIRYDKIVNKQITEEKFWEQFNTPINSMKGCHKECVSIIGEKYTPTCAIGSQSSVALQVASILTDRLNKKYNTNKNPVVHYLEITEGPFRYYNFVSPEKVKEYFEVWNDAIEFSLSDYFMRKSSACGGYMTCDYIPVGTANRYCDVKVLHFDQDYFTVNIYWTDRYFMPKAVNLPNNLYLIPGKSVEDFLEKNQLAIEELKKQGRWPKF